MCGARQKLPVKTILFLTAVLLFLSFNAINGADTVPAKNGVLDLSRYEFGADTIVPLDGEWQFYRNRFIKPGEFQDGAQQPDAIVKLPSSWRTYKINGSELSSTGYATYRLKVILPDMNQPLAIKARYISEAQTIFINGKIVSRGGVTGTDANSSVPGYGIEITSFIPTSRELEIVIHNSNFHFKEAGPCDTIYLGTENAVFLMRHKTSIFEALLFGSFLFMAIYHLILFMMRRREVYYLLFSILCFFIAIRTVITDERILVHYFPSVPVHLLLRTEFLIYYMGLPIMTIFFATLFRGNFLCAVVKPAFVISALFSLSVIFLPPIWFIETLNWFHFFCLGIGGYLFYVVIRLSLRGDKEALIQLAGGAVFFVTVVNDMLSSSQIVQTGYYSSIGFFIFIISQAVALSYRFNRTLFTAERLSAELQENNRLLSAEMLEKEQAKKNLEGFGEYLVNIINSLSSAIISTDEALNIIHINKQTIELFGISASTVTGKNIFSVLPQLRVYEPEIIRALSEGSPQIMRRERIEGKEDCFYDISVFHLTNLNGVLIRITDITDQEKRETHLRQVQKIEMVGNLASGLAHDFNNVLGGISGVTSLLRFDMEHSTLKDEDLINAIELIEHSAKRAADMVARLLAISRKEEIHFTPLDLNLVLSHTMKICRNSFHKSIQFSIKYQEIPAITEADPTRIEQAILNLCINACHAMTIMRETGVKDDDTLSAVIDQVSIDATASQSIPGAQPGDYWKLSIADTGVGIDSALMEKIFEPFFTTKSSDKGSGLGLAMTYSIVRQHGGFITVESEPGKGTVFSIFLKKTFTVENQDNAGNDEPVLSGSGKILVVDDDDIVRYTAEKMLIKCGYKVISARDGKSAILNFDDSKEDIKAVLLDVMMPGMSGFEVFSIIRNNKKDMKFIISSGSMANGDVEHMLSSGSVLFIQKPYTIQALSQKLRELGI